MVERVFLHIGAPKTGTTYLQQALGLNRRRMKDAGVLYPSGAADAHHVAVWDLREMWEQRDNSPQVRGAWRRTVDRVLDWEGPTALLSSELFVYADKAQAATALGSFGDAEVHVIYTARDLVRQVPAVWQERLKNQRTMPYEQFVTDVIGPSKSGMAKGFWSAQDTPTALQRWSQGIPPERVHVVTTPPSGSAPDVLWGRFMSVIGLDGPTYEVDVPAVNTSMGIVEAEVLRRLNQRHAQDLGPVAYRKIFRAGLFDVLADVVDDKVKIVLTPDEHNALVARGKQIADGIQRAGFDVVGALDELVPEPLPEDAPAATARRPGDVTQAEVVETLLDVVHALLVEQKDAREKADRAKRRRQRQKRAAD
jgi:hypothetical protein